jgi:hypothetical protein
MTVAKIIIFYRTEVALGAMNNSGQTILSFYNLAISVLLYNFARWGDFPNPL